MKGYWRVGVAVVMLLLLAACATGPVRSGADSGVEARLAAMPLEDKVGQLFMVCFDGPDVGHGLDKLIQRVRPGGIILFSATGNTSDPGQIAGLTNAAQALARRTGAGVPMFVAVDQEGGPVARLRQGFARFPSNMAVAATGDPANARLMAEAQGREMAAVGINVDLAPVADVNSNPANPIIGARSFGSDPARVAEFVAEAVRGYATAGVLSCAKHYPGHGDTDKDSHLDLPLVPRPAEAIAAVDWPPFEAAIRAGAPMIMSAHIVVPALEPEPGLPATLSPRILGDLRARGFAGLILTDSLGMNGLAPAASVPSAALLSFLSGADVLVFGPDARYDGRNPIYAYDRILTLVRSGAIAQSRLDDSVRRILKAKAAFGILEAKPAAEAQASVATAADEALVSRLAGQGLTLIRDPGHTLPLTERSGRVLVVHPQGRGGVVQALSQRLPGVTGLEIPLNPSAEDAAKVLAAAGAAERVVFCSLDAFRRSGQADLLKSLPPDKTILVCLGAPYDAGIAPQVAAVAAYSDVPASLSAVAAFLSGQAPAPGRLPVTLP